MINSTSRRAGLLLAAIASFSIRAAAQTDAAFASALGKVPAGLATMAQLKTQTQVPAAPTGPNAPADVFKKLFMKACFGGKVVAEGSHPNLYTCSLDFGDQATKHAMGALIGVILPAGAPIRLGATIGLEYALFSDMKIKYVPEDGQWRRDLCQFKVWSFRDGSPVLGEAVCNTAMSPTGDFSKGTDETLDLADPKTAARYNAAVKGLADHRYH